LVLFSCDPRSRLVRGRCLGPHPAGLAPSAAAGLGGLQLAGVADGGGKQVAVLWLRCRYACGRAWGVSAAWVVLTKVRSLGFRESCSSGSAKGLPPGAARRQARRVSHLGHSTRDFFLWDTLLPKDCLIILYNKAVFWQEGVPKEKIPCRMTPFEVFAPKLTRRAQRTARNCAASGAAGRVPQQRGAPARSSERHRGEARSVTEERQRGPRFAG
jgi:hypothetical protein